MAANPLLDMYRQMKAYQAALQGGGATGPSMLAAMRAIRAWQKSNTGAVQPPPYKKGGKIAVGAKAKGIKKGAMMGKSLTAGGKGKVKRGKSLTKPK